VETWEIGIAALGIGAHAKRQRHEIDKVAEGENASKLIERFDVFEEFTLQCTRIIGDQIIYRGRKRLNTVKNGMDDLNWPPDLGPLVKV
jgi:hypothetical protein